MVLLYFIVQSRGIQRRMGKKRKFLLYTHALTGGGAERVWALLASGLVRRGHDVLFVTDFEAEQNQSFVDAKVRRVTLGGNHLTNTLRLARLIRAEKPDVTLSALSASNLKHTIAALLAFRAGRAVLSVHGYASSEPQPLSRIGFFATPLISRLTAATICVSDGLTTYLIKQWRADPRKTRRIYNLVDGGTLAPATSDQALKARGPVVLSAGRFVSYKEFSGLVRAFSRVKPDNARLVMIGEGPDRSAIEAEIAGLGLQDRVSAPGYVAQPWSYYANAACFALASSQEPFGLVIVEALANGLPVVATNCAGPREILGDGQYGALTPIGDEQALATAISAALAAPGDPLRRIERASEFSLERGLDAYEALAEGILLRMQSPTTEPARFMEPDATESPAAVANLRSSISSQANQISTIANRRPRQRKALIYTHSLSGGGAERAVALLARGLVQRGYDVIVAIDYASNDNDPYLDPAIRMVTLGPGHLGSAVALTRLISHETPDVTISAMGASNFKHFCAAAMTRRRNRAVLTYHGFFESEPRFLSRLSFALTPILTRLTARTVAVSHVLHASLANVWRASRARTSTIYNPIDWGGCARMKTTEDLLGRPQIILASGRLTKLKNFDVLIRAFAKLRNKQALLVILGEGPERRILAAEVRRLGLDARVVMPGYVAEPWRYYDEASCFALSSSMESFGMVVVEALAYGLPVVATDCHGPVEILAGGRYGRIVPIGDEVALANALDATLEDPGDPAPRVAYAHTFSPEKAIDRYEALIEEICAQAEPLTDTTNTAVA